MDFEDKTMTDIILRMLHEGLIMFSRCMKTGVLHPVLTDRGRMIGEVISSFIDEFTSEANWENLRNAKGWKEVTVIALGIAANWAVKNLDLLVKLALRIGRLIENLFKNRESYYHYRPLPAQKMNLH